MNLPPGYKYKLTVFHCINVFGDGGALPQMTAETAELNFVKMPCSSMVKDLFLLRAFEAGADAVAVLVCAEGSCRYVEGNLRAKKRVSWVKALLDEIGLQAGRLTLFNVAAGDRDAALGAIREAHSRAVALGPCPVHFRSAVTEGCCHPSK